MTSPYDVHHARILIVDDQAANVAGFGIQAPRPVKEKRQGMAA